MSATVHRVTAERLALDGGPPAVPNLPDRRGGWPIWDETERQLLTEVLESGKWWRGGYEDPTQSKVGQFEEAFARFQDAKYAVAVTNGTTALECAYVAAGVQHGDEVIVPAVTFVATATAVLVVGATPIFVDVDPRNYTIDVQAVEAAITPRTRCIASVDYGGMPCDYDALIEIGRKHNIPVVADCAHAHGSQWNGRGVGALTELGTFSFQQFKQLTTGEGGMVMSNDETLIEKAYSYHHIGRIKGRPFYEHHVTGSNLRLTEWQGAIGLAQMQRFPEQCAIREQNSNVLAAGLARLEQEGVGVAAIFRDPRVTRWGFYMWHFKFLPERWTLPDGSAVTRDLFLKALRAEGVQCSTGHTQPLYKNPLFLKMGYSGVVCSETERIYTTEAVSLGHRLFLNSESDIYLILDAIQKIWNQREALARLA